MDDDSEWQAQLEIERLAAELAAVAWRCWHWGDGYGAGVMDMIDQAFHDEGLPRRKAKPWVLRSDVEALVDRDGWSCHYCRTPLGWGHSLVSPPETDHKVPRSRGGGDELDNLVLACAGCNQRKHARFHDDFCEVCR